VCSIFYLASIFYLLVRGERARRCDIVVLLASRIRDGSNL
jgi:hypothetical protein